MELLDHSAALTRELLLDKLLESYSAYFDIERMEELGGVLKAVASYHNFMEKYVLTRKARMWAAHAHEYIYLFTVERLDLSTWEKIHDFFMENGFSRMNVDKEHMYSYITPVILADEIDEDVKKILKRFHFYKSFKLSFYGWTTVRLAALEMSTGKIISNYQGRDVGRFVNKIYKEKTK